MSTGVPSINTSGGLTSTSTLTNNGAGGTLQLTGLASGIDTNALIQATLAEEFQPMTNMKNEITGINTEDQNLQNIQSALQLVASDAQMLGEPSLFFNTQTISSSDSNSVTAKTTSGPGAAIGSSVITVSQLAGAAQRSFSVATDSIPSSGDTLTVTDNGQTKAFTIAAGSSLSQLVSQINSATDSPVYATINSQTGDLVLSARSTGVNDDSGPGSTNASGASSTALTTAPTSAGTFIQVSDTAGLFTENTAAAKDGTDAEYTVNGNTYYSPTDTVTDAIPGVTLNLRAVTSNPVTVTSAPPAPSTDNITQAVQQFVTDYNNALSLIETQVETPPASASNPGSYNPNDGSLFGNVQLESFIGQMRQAAYTTPAGATGSLATIGIGTGTPTGSVTVSAEQGLLSVDTDALTAAITANPSSVKSIMEGFANSFEQLVNSVSGPVGSIQDELNNNNQYVSQLQDRVNQQQQQYNTEEAALEKQWASVEATMQSLSSQKTSLTSFESSLSSSSSSS